jgi:hypothetical protein
VDLLLGLAAPAPAGDLAFGFDIDLDFGPGGGKQEGGFEPFATGDAYFQQEHQGQEGRGNAADPAAGNMGAGDSDTDVSSYSVSSLGLGGLGDVADTAGSALAPGPALANLAQAEWGDWEDNIWEEVNLDGSFKTAGGLAVNPADAPKMKAKAEDLRLLAEEEGLPLDD